MPGSSADIARGFAQVGMIVDDGILAYTGPSPTWLPPNTNWGHLLTHQRIATRAGGKLTLWSAYTGPSWEGSFHVSTCRLVLTSVGLFPLHSKGSVAPGHVMSSRDGLGRRVRAGSNQGQHWRAIYLPTVDNRQSGLVQSRASSWERINAGISVDLRDAGPDLGVRRLCMRPTRPLGKETGPIRRCREPGAASSWRVR